MRTHSRVGELCWAPARFSLVEILVLAGTAGASRMAPPASTRVSDTLKCAGTCFTRQHVSCGDANTDPATRLQVLVMVVILHSSGSNYNGSDITYSIAGFGNGSDIRDYNSLGMPATRLVL